MQVESTPPSTPDPKTPSEHRRANAARGAMWNRFLDRVAALPGVQAAALGGMSPLTGRDRGVAVAIEGRQMVKGKSGTHLNTVSADFFTALGIQLRTGRLFTRQDDGAGPRVAILNQTAAQTWFPDSSPIGVRISFPSQRVDDSYEVIGVVTDARYVNLRLPDEKMIYIPLEQAIDPQINTTLVVRRDRDPAGLVPMIRPIAQDMVPGGFLARIGTMEERVSRSLLRERLLSMLATFFGALAMTLACVGLYGVLAYTVVRRSREIGVRIAVGAPQRAVAWMILGETLLLVVTGIVLGTVCATLASQWISSQFFNVMPGDPLATVAAVAILVGVTLLAAYLPTRRATRIDPVIVLRCE
jgi:predicted permease